MKPNIGQHILKSITLSVTTILFAHNTCLAQSSLHGSVSFPNHTPAANASVLLLYAKDTSLVKAIVCDKDGAYHFNNAADGNYIIAASFSGYNQAYSKPFSIDKKIGRAHV